MYAIRQCLSTDAHHSRAKRLVSSRAEHVRDLHALILVDEVTMRSLDVATHCVGYPAD